MMRPFLHSLLPLLALLTVLTGCDTMKPEQFAKQTPALALEEYFQGQTRAYGIVEDRFGNVRRQFVVDIKGAWNGRELTLDENFDWSDGEKERRVWVLTRQGPNQWEGRTQDAIGTAKGVLSGNAYNMVYDFNLKMGEGRTKVRFDDWMFLMPDGMLLNKATISKFGIHLATVTIAFRKDVPGVAAGSRQAAE
ncbi:DUF3833 domain-containing protein [Niveispirillum sp. SYP-B3756]|uniref:DUF3833 domain-containing protein n=1 Tax=Niveispirillum sp. SYP-B3756 TaxID=2662178 RepID=UPI001FFEC560|nr:DUF3833 domain-containing protein [Niveispirillum sp. SYP-B3756]